MTVSSDNKKQDEAFDMFQRMMKGDIDVTQETGTNIVLFLNDVKSYELRLIGRLLKQMGVEGTFMPTEESYNSLLETYSVQTTTEQKD